MLEGTLRFAAADAATTWGDFWLKPLRGRSYAEPRTCRLRRRARRKTLSSRASAFADEGLRSTTRAVRSGGQALSHGPSAKADTSGTVASDCRPSRELSRLQSSRRSRSQPLTCRGACARPRIRRGDVSRLMTTWRCRVRAAPRLRRASRPRHRQPCGFHRLAGHECGLSRTRILTNGITKPIALQLPLGMMQSLREVPSCTLSSLGISILYSCGDNYTKKLPLFA